MLPAGRSRRRRPNATPLHAPGRGVSRCATMSNGGTVGGQWRSMWPPVRRGTSAVAVLAIAFVAVLGGTSQSWATTVDRCTIVAAPSSSQVTSCPSTRFTALPPRPDLHGADLYGSSFAFAPGSATALAGADLSSADVAQTGLVDVDLSGTDLSGADLEGADLRGADLSNAILTDAVLDGANLTARESRRRRSHRRVDHLGHVAGDDLSRRREQQLGRGDLCQ